MKTARSVTQAIELLEADGYRSDFSFSDATVRCHGCGQSHPPEQLVVRHTFRFEGDTDPGDEAIVLGLECPSCGAGGIVVWAFGPDASADFMMLVEQLDD